MRPRTGEKARTLHDLIDLVVRATHEQELFSPHDWAFIQWLADTHRNRNDGSDTLILSDTELMQWLARWGHTNRLELCGANQSVQFHGQIIALAPHLENGDKELSFTPSFRAALRKFSMRRGSKIFQSSAAARDGGQYLLSAAQRASPAGAEISGEQTFGTRPQVEPSSPAAFAQNAIAIRCRLGTALCDPQRRAAICF